MRTRLLVPPLAFALFFTTGLDAQSPTGEWTLRVEWPARTATVKLLVSDSAGTRQVVWEGPQGRLTGSQVEWAEPQLKFELMVEDQGQSSIRLAFTARITGDELRGDLTAPGGRKIPVTGKRASKGRPSEPEAVVVDRTHTKPVPNHGRRAGTNSDSR